MIGKLHNLPAKDVGDWAKFKAAQLFTNSGLLRPEARKHSVFYKIQLADKKQTAPSKFFTLIFNT